VVDLEADGSQNRPPLHPLAILIVRSTPDFKLPNHHSPNYKFRHRPRTIKDSPSMSDLRRGLIIVNTGPGKGKTTAAMGTALRAVGQGMRVLMLQFLKGSWHYGELDAVQAFGDRFIMKQMGRGFVKVGAEKPDPEDVRMVEEAWAEAERAIRSGEWDLVVLDEISYAISYGMLDPAKVVESLKQKPEMVHVILTGRNAHPTIVDLADTVTEMRQVKHAYEKGVMAQRGIEY
jgi:cob(I)alamin adenosyltransferase